MIVRRSNRANTFNSRLEFSQIEYLSDQFYEVEFDYLINVDVCNDSDDQVVLRVLLYDQEYFAEMLFESNSTLTPQPSRIKWNKHKECFQVLGRNYSLQINAFTSCNIQNHEAFVAVDNLKIRKLDDSIVEEDEATTTTTTTYCKDIRITEKPYFYTTVSMIDTTTSDMSSSSVDFLTNSTNIDEMLSSMITVATTRTPTTTTTTTTTKKSGVLFGLDLWAVILIGFALIAIVLIATLTILLFWLRFKTKQIYPIQRSYSVNLSEIEIKNN